LEILKRYLLDQKDPRDVPLTWSMAKAGRAAPKAKAAERKALRECSDSALRAKLFLDVI
jgi:hypothetical protein